ncbi:quinolinate synthase NadA [Candidatus Margulisiibacteriota bacterium]
MKNVIEKIKKLRRDKNAVILAHNYQIPEVQDLADYVGDSLGLSIQASRTRADLIVFCGVRFMAETAALLSPQKTVLIPDINAGCPMADMISVPELQNLKSKHQNARIVCYVNSGADIKAESDICCTSANSIKVCNSINDTDEIIFVPDKYLGAYTQSKVKDKKFILWNGYCPTHAKILPEHIKQSKQDHPKAIGLVHPECRAETIALSDRVLSTGGMEKFAKKTNSREMIVATEIGMAYRLQKANPGKKFYPVSGLAICPNMKKINLEKILWSLEDNKERITIPDNIATKAKVAIDRMIEIGRSD